MARKKIDFKALNDANPIVRTKEKGLSATEQFHHYCDNTEKEELINKINNPLEFHTRIKNVQ